MAEPIQRPVLPQTNVQAPPIFAGSRVAVTVSPSDFMLSIGVGRPMFGANGEAVANTVEYHAGYSLSPTTAKQLAALLNLTLAKYEEAFGVIPIDAGSIKKMAELSKQPLRRIGKSVPVKEAPAAPAKKASKAR